MAAQTEFPMFCERENSKHGHIVANFGKKTSVRFCFGWPTRRHHGWRRAEIWHFRSLIYLIHTSFGSFYLDIQNHIVEYPRVRGCMYSRLAPSLSRMGFDRVYPVYYEISFELETENERDL